MAYTTISNLAKGIGGLLGKEWQKDESSASYINSVNQQRISQIGLQQQLANQMGYAYYGNFYPSGLTVTSDGAASAGTINITGYSTGIYEASRPKKETALEWLDRRVSEMQVAL